MSMRRARLRPMSDRRAALLDERRAVVAAAHVRDGWRCVAADRIIGHRCAGPLDAHEVIPRSAWRAGWLELSNVVTVCRAAHDWIGDHPDAAHLVGLHGYSWER